jgi:hypothetical protein
MFINKPYSAREINFRLGNRAYRDYASNVGNLEQESNKIIANELIQEERIYMNNKQELINNRNFAALDRTLMNKNSLAKPWYNSGAHEGLMLDETNDQALIQESRTSKQTLENKLQPSANPAAAASVQRSIRDLLIEKRNARQQTKRP